MKKLLFTIKSEEYLPGWSNNVEHLFYSDFTLDTIRTNVSPDYEERSSKFIIKNNKCYWYYSDNPNDLAYPDLWSDIAVKKYYASKGKLGKLFYG